ncbi:uncharacterized protein [Triticum aestivum]|uniref:uncharacterized protein isoform X2 n=1 Tax=Triticum aestivum TaxID=4565 RepID=UPI001D01C0FE|nr:uncharacterized protein LOC123106832 isoform X2 [Triticum aestivum]
MRAPPTATGCSTRSSRPRAMTKRRRTRQRWGNVRINALGSSRGLQRHGRGESGRGRRTPSGHHLPSHRQQLTRTTTIRATLWHPCYSMKSSRQQGICGTRPRCTCATFPTTLVASALCSSSGRTSSSRSPWMNPRPLLWIPLLSIFHD